MAFVVAIDGPAGSGKGTITKIVGKNLNLVNIDTGAMYRCIALECLRKKIDYTDLLNIEKVLEKIKIEFKKDDGKDLVFLNDENVSEKIRTPEVDGCVAKFASLKIVRDKVTPMQREMGKTANIIMEGRDIGTVVFPDADVKIFLDCSIEERAKRRYKQNIEKGINSTYEEVLQSIKERHILETQREISPLVQAEDAIYIDSTHLSIEEVCKKIIDIVNNVRNKK